MNLSRSSHVLTLLRYPRGECAVRTYDYCIFARIFIQILLLLLLLYTAYRLQRIDSISSLVIEGFVHRTCIRVLMYTTTGRTDSDRTKSIQYVPFMCTEHNDCSHYIYKYIFFFYYKSSQYLLSYTYMSTMTCVEQNIIIFCVYFFFIAIYLHSYTYVCFN